MVSHRGTGVLAAAAAAAAVVFLWSLRTGLPPLGYVMMMVGAGFIFGHAARGNKLSMGPFVLWMVTVSLARALFYGQTPLLSPRSAQTLAAIALSAILPILILGWRARRGPTPPPRPATTKPIPRKRRRRK